MRKRAQTSPMLLLRQRFHSIGSGGNSNCQSATLRTVLYQEGMVGTSNSTGVPRSFQTDMLSSSQLQSSSPSAQSSALAPLPQIAAPTNSQALRPHQGQAILNHHYHLQHQHQLPALVNSRFHQPPLPPALPAQGGALVRGYHPLPYTTHHHHHGRHPNPYPLRHPQHHGLQPHRTPGGVLPYFMREIYKNGFLKRLPYKEKRSSALAKLLKSSDRYWVVFSVHDEAAPFLELWNDPMEAAKQPPQLVLPLAICQHVSPSLVPVDNEWSFVINFETVAAIRFSCNSRQAMEEWVNCLRMKLGQMGVLNPKGNLYSKVTTPPQPLFHANKEAQQPVVLDQQIALNSITMPSVRDPTSPLPLPPLPLVRHDEGRPSCLSSNPSRDDPPAAIRKGIISNDVQVVTAEDPLANDEVLHIRAAAQVHHQEQQQLQPRTRTSIVVNELNDISQSYTTSIYLGQSPPKPLQLASSVIDCNNRAMNDSSNIVKKSGDPFVLVQKSCKKRVVVLPLQLPDESCCPVSTNDTTGPSSVNRSHANVRRRKVTGPSMSMPAGPLPSSSMSTSMSMVAFSESRAISAPMAKHVTVIPVNNNHEKHNHLDKGNEENVPDIIQEKQKDQQPEVAEESCYDAIPKLDEPGSANFDYHRHRQQQQDRCLVWNGREHYPQATESLASDSCKVPLVYSKSSPGLGQHSDYKKVPVLQPSGDGRDKMNQQASNIVESIERHQSSPESADSRQGEPLLPPSHLLHNRDLDNQDPCRGVHDLDSDAWAPHRRTLPQAKARGDLHQKLSEGRESDGTISRTVAEPLQNSAPRACSGSGASLIMPMLCSDRKSSYQGHSSQQQLRMSIKSRTMSSSLGPLMDDHHESMMRKEGSGGIVSAAP